MPDSSIKPQRSTPADHSPESLELDLQVNWHPLTPYRRQRAGEVVEVVAAAGSELELADGRRVIDGISSWWCKILGHQHPRLRAALIEQAGRIEHTIFANTTSAPLPRLSRALLERIPGYARVIYAGDGSSVVDMALKLSAFIHRRQGHPERHRFARLENAYHGESIAALSVSDVEKYISDFAGLCFPSRCIVGLPYIDGPAHPKWRDAEAEFNSCLPALEDWEPRLAAIIVEPLLQGAGGMRIYSADFLQRLCRWARERGIHIIADEIMTGMGRTGGWTAMSQTEATADIVLLSKGLTAGWMPFSALLCTSDIAGFALENTDEPFPHSHTYMGNPLGAALACAAIEAIESEDIFERVKDLEKDMRARLERIAAQTGNLENVRALGATAAAEISEEVDAGRISQLPASLLKEGLLLRPLGRTLYWMPPANIEEGTLARMEEITAACLSRLGGA